jgi:hypothetical protein
MLTFSVSVGTCRHFVRDSSAQGKWKLKITGLDCTDIKSSRKNKLGIGKNVGKSDYALIGSTTGQLMEGESESEKPALRSRS